MLLEPWSLDHVSGDCLHVVHHDGLAVRNTEPWDRWVYEDKFIAADKDGRAGVSGRGTGILLDNRNRIGFEPGRACQRHVKGFVFLATKGSLRVFPFRKHFFGGARPAWF